MRNSGGGKGPFLQGIFWTLFCARFSLGWRYRELAYEYESAADWEPITLPPLPLTKGKLLTKEALARYMAVVIYILMPLVPGNGAGTFPIGSSSTPALPAPRAKKWTEFGFLPMLMVCRRQVPGVTEEEEGGNKLE